MPKWEKSQNDMMYCYVNLESTRKYSTMCNTSMRAGQWSQQTQNWGIKLLKLGSILNQPSQLWRLLCTLRILFVILRVHPFNSWEPGSCRGYLRLLVKMTRVSGRLAYNFQTVLLFATVLHSVTWEEVWGKRWILWHLLKLLFWLPANGRDNYLISDTE